MECYHSYDHQHWYNICLPSRKYYYLDKHVNKYYYYLDGNYFDSDHQ